MENLVERGLQDEQPVAESRRREMRELIREKRGAPEPCTLTHREARELLHRAVESHAFKRTTRSNYAETYGLYSITPVKSTYI